MPHFITFLHVYALSENISQMNNYLHGLRNRSTLIPFEIQSSISEQKYFTHDDGCGATDDVKSGPTSDEDDGYEAEDEEGGTAANVERCGIGYVGLAIVRYS